MYTVLLIDDDERLGKLLTEYFSRYDLTLISEISPKAGLERLENTNIDLVILDIMLPEIDEPRELVARIHNILKRTQSDKIANKPEILQFPNLKIDKFKRLVTIKQQTIELTTKEYALLLLFAESPNKNFTRDEIMNALSGIDAELFSRSVDILVSRLRQKIQPLDYCIQTVWGTGYRFIPSENS